MARRPCAYADCGCHQVIYWGWYERKEGSIQLGESEVAGAIPIRRFRCSRCKRTFSWRPPFLVFGRSRAAPAYQQAFQAWALSRGGPEGAWYQLGEAACKAFGRVLGERLCELLARLGLKREPRRGLAREERPRSELWHLARRRVRDRKHAGGGPRLSVQVVCLALARHRDDGVAYRLESC